MLGAFQQVQAGLVELGVGKEDLRDIYAILGPYTKIIADHQPELSAEKLEETRNGSQDHHGEREQVNRVHSSLDSDSERDQPTDVHDDDGEDDGDQGPF